MTDPKVFKTLATSAVGVEGVESPSVRYTSLAFVQQASARTAIRHHKLLRDLPLPGEFASLDFTRGFTRDLEGHVCAAVILDIATYSLWVLPLFSKSGLEAARAVREYRALCVSGTAPSCVVCVQTATRALPQTVMGSACWRLTCSLH